MFGKELNVFSILSISQSARVSPFAAGAALDPGAALSEGKTWMTKLLQTFETFVLLKHPNDSI